jgi:hypothetical protein
VSVSGSLAESADTDVGAKDAAEADEPVFVGKVIAETDEGD